MCGRARGPSLDGCWLEVVERRTRSRVVLSCSCTPTSVAADPSLSKDGIDDDDDTQKQKQQEQKDAVAEPCVLLLRRALTSGNPGTLGLPGGNADVEDQGNLLVTACRESKEEMGERLPDFDVAAEILTKRGKQLQKHYTVFVAKVAHQTPEIWQPMLNEEHTEYHWIKLSDVANRKDLHPVVKRIFSPPLQTVLYEAVGLPIPSPS